MPALNRTSPPSNLSRRAHLRGLCALSLFLVPSALAQTQQTPNLSERVDTLKQAIGRTQEQLEDSQRQLEDLRHQLAALEQELKSAGATHTPVNEPLKTSSTTAGQPDVASAISDIQEQQSIEQAQIATHEQSKVESDSKYPVKITGLILFNGFVNTRAVDMPATPTVAVAGSGNTGATLRQTVLGFDAAGPHLFGAHSSADLRIDFEGAGSSSYSVAGYSGAYAATGLLRLRTAHASLTWDSTKAYFSLDRPLISPDVPTSLTAVAEPALAWSGDLWTWNPQLGITQDIRVTQSESLRLQAALIDAGDAPQTPVLTAPVPGFTAPTAAEQSRWPGVEARLALYGPGKADEGDHFGAGGYFSKHTTGTYSFDAWAGTLDARLHLPGGLQISGSAYRGAGLGGLGGGGYKDYVTWERGTTGDYYYEALDDVGGWAQVKKIFTPRWEANAAYGMDNVFAQELRHYMSVTTGPYQDLARNQTYTGNLIFRPSAYLLFSAEYRHIESAPVTGVPGVSHVLGVAAGYKF